MTTTPELFAIFALGLVVAGFLYRIVMKIAAVRRRPIITDCPESYWIDDPTQPSGQALNPAAFASPPLGQSGNLPRNGLRSPYSLNQTDLALRRQFNLSEGVKLDLRAEYFNVFNHPMFGSPGSQCNPDSLWGSPGGTVSPDFGKICPDISTMNVDANLGLNGQNALYAVGGPRSAQFAVKLHF